MSPLKENSKSERFTLSPSISTVTTLLKISSTQTYSISNIGLKLVESGKVIFHCDSQSSASLT